MLANLFVAASALFAIASAQGGSTNGTIGPCCTVDYNTISSSDKDSWCQAERNTCPEVCGGIGKLKSGGNTCDSTTLNYTCVCSDGTTPNISDYQQSVPALMCNRWFQNCITASGQDLQAQEDCKSVQCGNKTTDAATASSSAASSASASATSAGSGGSSATAASATASASHTGAAAALHVATNYGTPILAGGLMAMFGLAL